MLMLTCIVTKICFLLNEPLVIQAKVGTHAAEDSSHYWVEFPDTDILKKTWETDKINKDIDRGWCVVIQHCIVLKEIDIF